MKNTVRLSTLALGALLLSTASLAQNADRDARARYQADRQACLSGNTHQARSVCLREAGAALQEARRGRLTTAPNEQEAANAVKRCDAFKNAEDRAVCVDRIQGAGTTTGSVEEGGVLRETVTTVPN